MSETTESSSSFEMLHNVTDEEYSFVSNGSSRSLGDGVNPSSISGNSSSASTSTQDFAIIRSPPFASSSAATLIYDSHGQGSGGVDVTTEISEATFSLDDEEAAMMYARADTEKTSNVIHHSSDSVGADEEDLDTQLALRTSQLMSSYLDYVKEIDNRDSTSNAVSVDYAPPSPPPLIVAADHQGGSALAAASATPSNYPRSNNSNNNIDYSAPHLVMSSQYPTVQQHRIKYIHPIFHSRKFKRSLCMLAIVGCVVVGMVVVTSVTKKEVMQQHSPTTTTTPTTEDAAGISFIKKKEEEGFHWEVEPLHYYQNEGEDESGGSFNKDYEKIVSFSTGPIITGSASSPSLSAQGGGGEGGNHHQQQQIGNILHQQFKPLWFSTQDGWNGGSHADAIEFCRSVRNRNLCPYAVICPNGDGSDAFVMPGHSYGHKSEFIVDGEQYAPVYGSGNNWVLIGEKEQQSSGTTSSTTKNKCKTTLQLDGTANPYWGWSSERADMKKHIMCCNFD
jgi:hypothetical protein